MRGAALRGVLVAGAVMAASSAWAQSSASSPITDNAGNGIQSVTGAFGSTAEYPNNAKSYRNYDDYGIAIGPAGGPIGLAPAPEPSFSETLDETPHRATTCARTRVTRSGRRVCR